jgi:DNA-binding beta-propeller fold protein YncE
VHKRLALVPALMVLAAVGVVGSPTFASATGVGTKLWASLYHGPVHGTDEAFKVAVSPDGSKVFVTGLSDGQARPHVEISDYATVAYDAASGTQLWATRYNGPTNAGDSATSLAVSPDGSKVFVTGFSYVDGNNADYVTLAYDASTGVKVWLKRYGRAGHWSGASSIAASPDGSEVFVTGTSARSTSGYDYATVAYDAATGMKRWATRYNGPANRDDGAQVVGVSPDGSKVFVTGATEGSTGREEYATVGYDASSGAQLWAKLYSGPADRQDTPSELGVSPDGSKVFVTGFGIGSTGIFHYATLAYAASSGARLWLTRYSGLQNAGAQATSLAVSPDGSQVFVTGYSRPGVNLPVEYVTFAYDAANGTKVWGPRLHIGYAYSIAVSPDGSKVFVTGEGRGYATVAYAVS